MFCSACGAEVSIELNYCKRCGKDLSGVGNKQSATEIESLIWAIVGITVGGIGVTIGLIAVMKEVAGLTTEVITLITLVSFFLILIADVAFILMLLKRSGASAKSGALNYQKDGAPQKLVEMPAAQQLYEAMPPTVTEHTTRNLEPVYRESKKE